MPLHQLDWADDGTREAEQKDRVLLMRAVVNVVLQRELSLSRRVYTWLLGPEETSEKQVGYFRRHGLELLAPTLEVGRVSARRRYIMLTLRRWIW
jgi:hypothetical protein